MNPARLDMILRLRRSGISSNRVLEAMETLPRAAFLAQHLSDFAYQDNELPIECGQVLPAPLTCAAMIQAPNLSEEDKVLEIGTGSGYQAAIASRLCKRVYSVERYKTLSVQAGEVLTRQGLSNITLRHGDGRYGWRGQAPFDAVMVTAGLKVRPVTLLSQVKPGGRLICVMNGVLQLYSKTPDQESVRAYFPISLPALEPGKSKVI